MRIVAGQHRGRPLAAPPDEKKAGKTALRPTSDRVREALFNILQHPRSQNSTGDDGDHMPLPALAGARVADLFCGTGALGLEALSRGAAHAVFVDQDPGALALVRRNIGTLKEEGRSMVLAADASALPPAPQPCDIAFLDPPYGMPELLTGALIRLAGGKWLRPGGLAVVELPAKGAFTPPPGFHIADRRLYGGTAIVFLKFSG